MQIRVFSSTAQPAVNAPLYFLKSKNAPRSFREAKPGDVLDLDLGGKCRKIDRCSVQLLQLTPEEKARRNGETVGFWDGPLGIGNVLPFSRNTSGEKLHYEIPMAGDRSVFARHRRRRISVSGRLALETAAMQMVAAFNARIRLKQMSA